MKQTAVEFYAIETGKLEIERAKGLLTFPQMFDKMLGILNKAKEMEKEQIIKSAQDNFYAGQDLENGYKIDWNSAEDYYKITFKSE